MEDGYAGYERLRFDRPHPRVLRVTMEHGKMNAADHVLHRELGEAATIYKFSPWQRLFSLELPYAAIGLVWNSMVSVAGGWFFLMACEMFVLGTRDFRLPGLGSYLQTAASTGNFSAIAWGLATMIAIIVATDQLIWRPIIAWSDRFDV